MNLKLGKLNIGWGSKAVKPQAGFFRIFGTTFSYANTDEVESYTTNAALYSVINRISRTAATAPFKVYRVKDKKKFQKYKAWTGINATKESVANALTIKSQVFEEDNDHLLNELIEKPNDFQAGSEFTANSIGYKLITGNRFLFLNKLEMGLNKGQPFSIYNLPPQNMEIKGDGTLFGVSGYRLNLGQYKDIDKDAIIHSRYWNPTIDAAGTHLRGLSPLSAASKNLTRAMAGLDRSVAMLENAGAAGVLFEKSPIEMKFEDAEALKLKVNTEVLGTANAGKIAVANGDMGYVNFGLSAVEMSVLEMEKYSLQQICNIYGVPFNLFDTAHTAEANVTESKKELITMAVVPELATMRDDWNKIAELYPEEIYVDYDLSVYPEMQEDMGKTADIMAKAWWFTPNEKRLAMMQDEDTTTKEMNMYVIPSGLQLIEDLSNLEGEMNAVDEELKPKPNNQSI